MKFKEIDSALHQGNYYLSGNEAVAEGAIEIMERFSLRFKDVRGGHADVVCVIWGTLLLTIVPVRSRDGAPVADLIISQNIY